MYFTHTFNWPQKTRLSLTLINNNKYIPRKFKGKLYRKKYGPFRVKNTGDLYISITMIISQGVNIREQTKVGFQKSERNQEVPNSSKTGTKIKTESSNFEKQELLLKPRTKPIIWCWKSGLGWKNAGTVRISSSTSFRKNVIFKTSSARDWKHHKS